MNGIELRRVLANKRISIVDLAVKLGMTQPNLSNQFKVQDVKSGMLEKICDVLGVTMDFFYEGTKYIKKNEMRCAEGQIATMAAESIGDLETKTKEEEIMYLKGQVQALKEMNQMLLDKNAVADKSLSYQKKNA